MNKVVLMYLTEVSTVANEAGQEKIERTQNASRGGGNVKKDDYGRTAEWYEDQGIRVPHELIVEKEDEIDEDGVISLNMDEVEYEFYDAIISLNDFMTAIDHPQIGSILFTKQNFQIHVQETTEEINFQIWYLQRSWWERFKEGFFAIKGWLTGNKKKTIKF